MMAHGFQLESARQEATDRQRRRSRQTSALVLEGERCGRGVLRRSIQLDDREMLAPSQVADREFNVLASTTTHLRLWACARRASRPLAPRLESWLETGWTLTEIDFVRRRGVQGVVRPIPVVQPHDETPIVPRLSFRTGGIPGTEGQPGSCARGRRDLRPFST